MSNYFYSAHQQHMQNPHPMAPSVNHHGRSRRAQRLSSTQPGHRQQRQQQQRNTEKMILTEAPAVTAFRTRFEAGRSFDLDDDIEFCPNLLTFDERQSVASGSSDRSSLSSGSPDHSPLQQQIQPQQIAPALSLSAAASSYVSPPVAFNHLNVMKLHQPSAVRSRNNAIPIVNPSTGSRIASPPSSISPSIMQQTTATRRW